MDHDCNIELNNALSEFESDYITNKCLAYENLYKNLTIIHNEYEYIAREIFLKNFIQKREKFLKNQNFLIFGAIHYNIYLKKTWDEDIVLFIEDIHNSGAFTGDRTDDYFFYLNYTRYICNKIQSASVPIKENNIAKLAIKYLKKYMTDRKYTCMEMDYSNLAENIVMNYEKESV